MGESLKEYAERLKLISQELREISEDLSDKETKGIVYDAALKIWVASNKIEIQIDQQIDNIINELDKKQ